MDTLSTVSKQILEREGYASITHNKKDFSIKLLSTSQGTALAMRLFKLCLPALGTWLDSGRKEGLILPEDDDLFSEVTLLLVTQLDQFDLDSIMKALLKDALVDGEDITYDSYFAGNYGELIALVGLAIKENKILDFFTESLKLMGLDLQRGIEDLKTLIEQNKKPLKKDTETTSEK